jgi:hypothetical protein
MVSYIKNGRQAKDHEANIWVQKGVRLGREEGFTMRYFIVYTVRIIYSLNLED